MVCNGIYKSNCKMCHGGCGVLVHVKNGRVVKIEADRDFPTNKGWLGIKAHASIDLLYHPDRLRYPIKRMGERGEGKWKRVSWDEALGTIACKLIAMKERYGAEALAIQKGTSTNNFPLLARLANLFGTPNLAGIGYFCFIPRASASYVTGGGYPEWEWYPFADYDNHSQCILVWGAQPEITNDEALSSYKFLRALPSSKLIVVDPRYTYSAAHADLWLQIRPGTDAALALGMLNVIINEGLFDKDFVENYTYGFGRLVEHVQKYKVEKVSQITGIAPQKISAAAILYAQNKPACICAGTALEHNINAFQTQRAIIILMGITGNLDRPGGNVYYEANHLKHLALSDKLPPAQAQKRIGSRFKGLSFGPFVQVQSPSVYQAIITGKPYLIRALLIWGNNPMCAFPNTGMIKEALMKIDFSVAVDFFLTPSAELVDIVLPAATWLEREHMQVEPSCYIAEGHSIIPARQRIVEVEECWDDWRIIVELGKKLGFKEYFVSQEKLLDEFLEPLGITFQDLKEKGYISRRTRYYKYEKTGFPSTPSKKFEVYSQILEERGDEPLPTHVEPHESPVSTPELAQEYPLILITGAKLPNYWHSQYRQIASLRDSCPDPLVEMNPQTASKYDISQGDWVYIESPRGKIKMKAQLTKGIDPVVVHAQHGWWFPEKDAPDHGVWDSNVNLLTDDQPADSVTGSSPINCLLCKIHRAE